MQYVHLGTADIRIPRVCLGMGFRSGVDEDRVRDVIWKGFELGCNFLDVANVYAAGRLEEAVGKAVKGSREKFIITTKVGTQAGDPHPLSQQSIFREIEASLKRLQTEFVDFYLCHKPDSTTPISETFEAMALLKEQGKARHIGVSNFDKTQLAEALSYSPPQSSLPESNQTCVQASTQVCVCNQVRYNLLARNIEVELIPYCKENGVTITAYSPAFIGLLSGEYRFGNPPVPGRYWATRSRHDYNKYMTPAVDRVVETLIEIAREKKSTPTQIAIAWVLSHPEVGSVITGADTIERVESNIQASEIELSADERQRLDAISEGMRVDG